MHTSLLLLLLLLCGGVTWGKKVSIPGCFLPRQQNLCEALRQTNVDVLGTKKLVQRTSASCPNDKERVLIACETRESAGCLPSRCQRKDDVPSNAGCLSVVVDDNDDPIFDHSVNAYQESCSLEDGTEGEINVCCQQDAGDGILLAGYGAEPHEFPHQALIHLKPRVGTGATATFLLNQCGGTIYNENWIITAAHCVVSNATNNVTWYSTPFDANQVEIIVGTNIGSAATPTNTYHVKRIVVHERYSSLWTAQLLDPLQLERPDGFKHIYNDIALLEIDGKITFSENVKALRVAASGFNPTGGAKKAVIVGWGTTDDGDVSDHLQKTDVVIHPDVTCDKKYGSTYYSTQHLCLGGIVGSSRGKVAGGGDSGGPAICRDANGRGVLCGVTSFSRGTNSECSTFNNEAYCFPSVYVEVSNFFPWINATAGPQDTGKTEFHDVPLYGKKATTVDLSHQVTSPHLHVITQRHRQNVSSLPHVELQSLSTNGSNTVKRCGGTLVSPNVVVTAAHCVFDVYDNDTVHAKEVLSVRISGGRQYNVSSLGLITPRNDQKLEKLNERFVRKFQRGLGRILLEDPYYKYNIAVLHLETNVVGATPIPIQRRNVNSASSTYEVSWTRQKSLKELRKFDVNLLPRETCDSRYGRMSVRGRFPFSLAPSDVCFVQKFSGGNTCDDTLIGGGVVCSNDNGSRALCGIQTFRLCDFSLPKVMANLAFFRDVILDYVNEVKE